MKITFLGTGAADWNAQEHRHMAGYRRNSSALIDDCLLIDPGPDVPEALTAFGKCPKKIRYIINTHRHSDHYSEDTVNTLAHAKLISIPAGETCTVGPYTVKALAANHATCPDAVHFLLTDGEKTLFYGLDGAWLLYEEVMAIQATTVDLAVFDATIGDVPGDYRVFEHNNLNMVREIQLSLGPCVKRICISHLARTLHTDHATLSATLAPRSIEVAYDGWETEI